MTEMTTSNQNLGQQEKCVLIVLAAGASTRMGKGIKKEYLPLNGGTVLSCAVKSFLQALHFETVCIVYPFANTQEEQQANIEACQKAVFSDSYLKTALSSPIFISGGASRRESVCKALDKLYTDFGAEDPLVFIHDGARPFLDKDLIKRTFDAASETGAAVPGLQPVDTQKELDENGFIKRHLTRAQLCAVQTPQVFRLKPIYEAHLKAAEQASLTGKDFTDDTEIWDLFTDPKIYSRVKVVAGSSENKKITYKQDINSEKEQQKMIRTGLGYDKHILTEGRKLMLGGVEIPSQKGEAGHSDGDVLLHAITDALLGASAMGDIGAYFPPSEQKWKDADSKMLLATVWKDITSKGWKLGNLDCVIALESPKFLPYRDKVRESIAEILGCQTEQVFVKAKTGEKIGDIGKGLAVETWATCLLEK